MALLLSLFVAPGQATALEIEIIDIDCESLAERARERCEPRGGSEEECQEAYDAALALCENPPIDIPPIPFPVPGDSEERCAEITNRFLSNCSAVCEGDRPDRPDPPACEDRCAAAADRLGNACAERGGSEEECADAVEAFLGRCMAGCQPSPDGGGAGAKGIGSGDSLSDQLCTKRANELSAACLTHGGTGADCSLLGFSFQKICSVEVAAIDDWAYMARMAPPRPFLRGDANHDGGLDISDPLNTLFGMFAGSGNAFTIDCPDRHDADDDGAVTINDPLMTLRHLFLGDGPLAAPSGSVGQDPTFDFFVCYE